jgi:excinuclease ABC subunit A
VVYDLSEDIELELTKKHDIDIVIDRLVIKDGLRPRLADSVESALHASDGKVNIYTMPREGEGTLYEFSTNYACPEHGISFGELEPRSFSFNNPFGACPHCLGIGEMRNISPDKIIPDHSLSLSEGAIQVNGFKTIDMESWTGPLFAAVCERIGASLDTPIKDFSKQQLDAILYGTGDEYYTIDRYFAKQHRRQTVKFEGVIKTI